MSASRLPALQWHVCPVCGLAGWAGEGFSYCRQHGEQPETPFAALDEPEEMTPTTPDGRPLTMIEIVLGRQILGEPPSLGALVKRFGGYANITAEGWAEYDAARSVNADQPEKEIRRLPGPMTPGGWHGPRRERGEENEH